MVETPKITLNDRTKWISVDEYTGGSFFYSEWIDAYSSTKWFKLWPNIWYYGLNTRADWFWIAIAKPSNAGRNIIFTSDGYIESDTSYYAMSDDRDNWLWWAYYKRPTWTYVNWIAIWSTLLWITADKIDRITTLTSLFGSNLITNPSLVSNTWWTVWSWWWTSVAWAKHTSWTDVLSQTIAPTWTNAQRIAVRMTWCTTGTCTVWVSTGSWQATFAWTLSSTSDAWSVFTLNNIELAGCDTLRLTPSTWFNGTIEFVGMYEYDVAKLLPDNISITSYTSHPTCIWNWDLFIGSWSSIDVVDTSTRLVDTFNIIDSTYVIKSITQIWWSLIIWASDWNNSKQYYWNGVDETASEVIDWSWMDITNVVSDETKSFVLTGWQWDRQRLYVVSQYTRQLLAKYNYVGNSIRWRDFKKYNPTKKFEFYNYNCNSMNILNDILYVPSFWGIYSYWHTTPWLTDCWNKEIIFNTDWASTNLLYAMNKSNWELIFTFSKWTSINYIWKVNYYANCLSWYLVSNPILWDNMSTEKNLTKLKLWFKNNKSTRWNIKVHAIVDDYYFWTLSVTWVSVTPTVWSIYSLWSTVWTVEVISTSITWWAWTIECRLLTADRIPRYNYLMSITKVSWIWDSSITVGSYTNMILVKTISSDNQWYGSETIFWQSFIDTYMPNRRKLQLVIELYSNSASQSPEVYDISILSDIVNQDV
jgi:hypothetical protein